MGRRDHVTAPVEDSFTGFVGEPTTGRGLFQGFSRRPADDRDAAGLA
jgi:hypothetical protein